MKQSNETVETVETVETEAKRRAQLGAERLKVPGWHRPEARRSPRARVCAPTRVRDPYAQPPTRLEWRSGVCPQGGWCLEISGDVYQAGGKKRESPSWSVVVKRECGRSTRPFCGACVHEGDHSVHVLVPKICVDTT